MIETYYRLPISISLLQKHRHHTKHRAVPAVGTSGHQQTHTLGLRLQMGEEDNGHLWLLLDGKWYAGELLCDTFEDVSPIQDQNLINFYKAIL